MFYKWQPLTIHGRKLIHSFCRLFIDFRHRFKWKSILAPCAFLSLFCSYLNSFFEWSELDFDIFSTHFTCSE